MFICGGYKSSTKFIVNGGWILNPKTLQVEDCKKMFDGRFAHGVIQKGNYIYALAGNSYGKGPESTMRFCERYSLEHKKWEQIGNLNERRCAMVTLVWQN